jgi:hypothetical protein
LPRIFIEQYEIVYLTNERPKRPGSVERVDPAFALTRKKIKPVHWSDIQSPQFPSNDWCHTASSPASQPRDYEKCIGLMCRHPINFFENFVDVFASDLHAERVVASDPVTLYLRLANQYSMLKIDMLQPKQVRLGRVHS